LIAPIEFESAYPYQQQDVARDRHFNAGLPFYDPYTMFGHLAALTRTIKFGIGVSIVPLRDPYHLARSIVTIDHLAPGRFLLGIGTGWLREEFDIVGIPFRGRGARLDEMLDVMERLWRDEVAAYEGDVFSLPPARFEPKPVSSRPPYVFGGHSDVALRRAAARGDAWLGVDLTPSELQVVVARLRHLRRERGIGSDLEISILLGLADGDPEGTGILERLSSEVIEQYATAGADRLVIRPWRKGSQAVANLRLAADSLGLVPGAGSARRNSAPDG
jgi:probable F420-dependent oxidoreductase